VQTHVGLCPKFLIWFSSKLKALIGFDVHENDLVFIQKLGEIRSTKNKVISAHGDLP